MRTLILSILFLILPCIAPAQDLKPGKTINYEDVGKLQGFMPEEMWEHRNYFFFPGMKLELTKTRNYSPSYHYQDAHKWFPKGRKSEVSIGPDGSLQGYLTGPPFFDEGTLLL